jgi:hypothetical protein
MRRTYHCESKTACVNDLRGETKCKSSILPKWKVELKMASLISPDSCAPLYSVNFRAAGNCQSYQRCGATAEPRLTTNDDSVQVLELFKFGIFPTPATVSLHLTTSFKQGATVRDVSEYVSDKRKNLIRIYPRIGVRGHRVSKWVERTAGSGWL